MKPLDMDSCSYSIWNHTRIHYLNFKAARRLKMVEEGLAV